jgi:hypothetical protein
MLISSVLTGNILGVIAGEWKDVPPKPKVTMVAGVLLLMTAIVVLGRSASLVS